jgi:hypothetical protein
MRIQIAVPGLIALSLTLGTQTPPQGATKAAEVLAATRKAIGQKTIESLKTFSAEARMQRNVGQFQMNTDVEMLLELPDKFARTDASSGGPMSFQTTTGFNGDQSLTTNTPGVTTTMGGATMIRMGPGGQMPSGEKPTPEQIAERNKATVRSARAELSRLMLGWFGMAHPSIKAEYSYAGQADSPDGKAHVIDVKGADGFAARLFIDEQTHLPLVLHYQGPQPRVMTSGPGGMGGPVMTHAAPNRTVTEEERKKAGEEAEKKLREIQSQPPTMVEYKLFFSDWAEVDGLQFPRKIQKAIGDTTQEEWSVTKVKVNPKIDAKKFQVQS